MNPDINSYFACCRKCGEPWKDRTYYSFVNGLQDKRANNYTKTMGVSVFDIVDNGCCLTKALEIQYGFKRKQVIKINVLF